MAPKTTLSPESPLELCRMKWVLLLLFFLAAPLAADDEILLSCQVTQIAASENEGKTDAKLKKIHAFIEKDESLKKYKAFKFISKKSMNSTKAKSGNLKLKNKHSLGIRPVSISRAQRKNTITVDVSLEGSSGERKFIDREYLLLNAGALDKKSDLLLAVTCPVFP